MANHNRRLPYVKMVHIMNNTELEIATINAYKNADGELTNKDLYEQVATSMGLTDAEINNYKQIGASRSSHNVFFRKVRFVQQTLKQRKLLQRVNNSTWSLIKSKSGELTKYEGDDGVVAFCSNNGVAIWTKSPALIKDIPCDEFHALITSTPYPLSNPRAYGNPHADEFNDFICRSLEPLMSKLSEGGSIALNVSNDIFKHKSPARNTYWYRLVGLLEDRLGLHFMDMLPWKSNKIPTPTQYACVDHVQLRASYEPILWFTNNPQKCFADNKRIREPHTESHKRFIKNGGTKSLSVNGDGAYVKRVGGYSKSTLGRIPINILEHSNYCKEGRETTRWAKSNHITPHSAKMPLSVAEKLVKFLTRPGDTVIDIFAGTCTTGQASEKHGRHWVMFEMILEYLCQGYRRFRDNELALFNQALLCTPSLWHLSTMDYRFNRR